MKALLKKWEAIPEKLKATLVFAIASFATSGINYITTPIFTRLLSSAQYGTVAVYNSWYSIIRVFASMTLIFPGILNVGLYDHSDNRWKYLSSMLGITSVATLALSLGYTLFADQVELMLGLPASLIILMLLVCFTQPATTFWTYKQRYEYQYKTTFVVSVGSAILAQCVAIVAVLAANRAGSPHLEQVRLWSAGLVNAVVGIVLFAYICSKGKKFADIPLWKKTAVVALPLIPHYLASELLHSMDKIMIDQMVGADKAGIYSLAAILSSIGILLWRALNIMFGPFVNRKLGERDFPAIRTQVKPLLTLTGIMCVVAALAAPEIIRILATEDYIQAVYVVPPIAAGVFIHALYDVFSAVAFFHKKSFRIMMATCLAALANLVMNYVCIKQFGYIAAGYTTLASNLFLTLMHYWNMRRIEKEQIYDGKFSFLLLLAVVVACLLCNFLYGMILIRYILIAVLMVIVLMGLKREGNLSF